MIEARLFEVEARYFRPTEVELLVGNATKAKQRLGWSPRVTFINLASGNDERRPERSGTEPVLLAKRLPGNAAP